MAQVNNTSSSITALLKYYDDDPDMFYTAVSTAAQHADTLYAAMTHSSTSTSQSLYRFIRLRAESSSWKAQTMLDAVSGDVIEICGQTTSQFERLGKYVIYSNYDDEVKLMKARTSSSDTDSRLVFKAGLPDPDSTFIVDAMDEATPWSAQGTATPAIKDTAPTHRLEGSGSIKFKLTAQNTHQWVHRDVSANFTAFSDGTTATGSDYVAFEVFRHAKNRIEQVRIRLYDDTATGDYFEQYICQTPTETGFEADAASTSITWNEWSPKQTSFHAQWKINPYDNVMFKARLRRAWWYRVGTAMWSAITAIQVQVKADEQTSGTRECAVSIDNIRLQKSPPIGGPHRIQMATCEHEESASTYGWEKIEGTPAGGTKCDHNYDLSSNGYACLIVTARAAAAGSCTATLKFDSPKNLAVFPDGSTATAGDVFKVNASWKGLPTKIVWEVAGAANFEPPKIRFTDSGGNYSECKFWAVRSLLGGGDAKQIKFNLNTAETTWQTAVPGTNCDFTAVAKINIFGPFYNGQAAGHFIVDDMRIERPNAMQAVNIFEPVELIAIDSYLAFMDAHNKDIRFTTALVAEGLRWLFHEMRYNTYGMGAAIYPDYEHSSIGIAGLTLQSWGSKTFGMFMHNDKPNRTLDLTSMTIPSTLWPPEWDPDNGKYLFWKFDTVPAGSNDKFSIWIATPEIRALGEFKIKIHPATAGGGSTASQENYWEYSIQGATLAEKIAQDTISNAQDLKYYEAINESHGEGKSSRRGISNQFFNNDSMNKKGLWGTDSSLIRMLGADRGGWPSAIFEWYKKDMVLVTGTSDDYYAWDNIRGLSIEITGTGSNATICVDNLMMHTEGALKGDYYYKVLFEDENGYASPSSEPSLRVHVDKKDIVLNKVPVPSTNDMKRVKNKKIYRMGGTSTEWLEIGSMSVEDDQYFDNMFEEDAGKAIPSDKYGPPKAKIVKRISNAMYYGNVVDRMGDVRPYSVYKSEAFCPFRVDDFECIDIPETQGSGITGIEEYYNHICMFTADSMWTIDRSFRGVPVRRTDRGCVASRSIARSDYGMIWLSANGLMMGNISHVDDQYFQGINGVFASYTEADLADAVGFIVDKYYYLFYDAANGKGIVCYLPDKLFGELKSDAFDVKSVSKWDGRDDQDDIYYGRTNNTIFKMFDGETDNATAITTELTTKDFSQPGIMHDKSAKALYVAMGTTDVTSCSTLTPTINISQSGIESIPGMTANTTTVKTFVSKAGQGNTGSHVGFTLSGKNRHRITEMVLKLETEEDVEFMP